MERICKNCKHSKKVFKEPVDLYCYNPECDIEFSDDEECDHYMSVVEENDTCKLCALANES